MQDNQYYNIMYPLSQSQLGIYFTCQHLNETTGNYQMCFLYRLTPTINLKQLKRSLEAVVAEHSYIASRISISSNGIPTLEQGKTVFKAKIQKIKSIVEVRSTFCRTMNLDEEQLFRAEIYETENGNFLYLDFHHIIMDGMSLGMFMSELEKSYAGEALQREEKDGFTIALDEVVLRESEKYEEARQWYEKEFAGAIDLESTPLPDLYDNGEQHRFINKEIRLALSQDELTQLSQQYSVHESVLFTAAYGQLLANYSAEDKAAFSTIYHGRSDHATRHSLTMMVHTIPVFLEMPNDKSTEKWLKDTENHLLTARQYQYYSFADAVNDLGLKSDLLFAYQGHVISAKAGGLCLGGENLEYEDMRTPRSGMKLSAQVFCQDNGYTIRFSYYADQYSSEMIDGMAESYTSIIKSLATAQSIGELQIVNAQQQSKLDSFNPTLWEYDSHSNIVNLFRQQAQLHPQNIAVVYQSQQYTYQQVDELSDRLAAYIHKLGIQAPSVVSILIPRCEYMAIASLGVLKAGCTYQPLDPSYPTERLNFMLEDAEAQLLITTQELQELVTSYHGKTFDINTLPTLDIKEPAPEVNIQATDLFILLYTSGTTGTPKGCMLTHGNLCAFSTWYREHAKITPESKAAAYASYGFDACMMDMYPTLISGAALHIIPEEIRLDLVAINDYFEANGITHSFMTTQVGTQMAINFPNCQSLHDLSVGGEKLVSLDPPSYRFRNIYGPTECTVFITDTDVTKNEPNIPVGKATGNTHLYIVNKAGKRLPIGAAGELWVSGSQVSKGYLKRSDKTNEVFIANPFEDDPRLAHIYRTGDIVRYRKDGNIEFVGRKDGQVKIRGFRIELKEVEAVIRTFSGIDNVTVQAFDLEGGGKAICAYIVAKEKIDIDELNQFIASQKPPYMVPAVTMQIDAIPLNVNQKIDKKRLPKPTLSNKSESEQPAAPLNELEEQLMAMVEKIIGTRDFSITTPLTQVGLTSITSIKLSTQLFKTFGISINSKDLIQAESIQSIENKIFEFLLNLSQEDSKPTAATTSTTETPNSVPLSNAQLGIYYECLKDMEATTYNVPTCVRFPKSVKADELKKALIEAIAAHPLLSAHFDNSSETILQVFDPNQSIDINMIEGDLEDIKKTYVRAFNLHRGPLYRATIVMNKADQQLYLLWDVHHLVMDGGSLSIFLHQLCAQLDGETIEKEEYTFFDYVKDEQAQDLSTAAQFFDSQLKTIEESSSFPEDIHGKEEDGKIAIVKREVDFEKIQQFCRQQNITPAVLFLAATEYITARYTNSHDICICTISSGRSNVRIADTVGMFINTLPLIGHIANQSIGEFLQEVNSNFNETLRNENYPFAKIASTYGIHADIMYEYQVGVIDKIQTKGEDIDIHTFGLETAKFKTAVKIEEEDGKIFVKLQYNDAIYSHDMMSRLAESMSQVINTIMQDTTTPLKTMSIISPSQAEELDRIRNKATFDIPIKLYHQGIEKFAKETPDHLALIASDQSLTYAEMNAQMNRIAHSLIERGVGKGDAVAILLPRTSKALLSMFAILKTGAAFIPCDPAYPAERIQLILEDSDARFVITTEDRLASYPDRAVNVDDLLDNANSDNPNVDIRPEDLAYMIYTSGSTGRPKGVMLRHIGICSYLTAHPCNRHIHTIANTVHTYLSVSTISFDLSFKEYGAAFFNGLTCVFADDSQSNNPVELAALMQRTDADCINGTPSRILQYMELPEFCDCLKKCHVIMSGGEKYSDKLLSRLHELTDARIFNTYGPTEITVSCNVAELTKTNNISVGEPLLNYTEFVVDPDGNELPVGVVGELYVGGPGVAVGYNHLDELNAKRFIEYKGIRIFKSGDYARWQADGQVLILGRADNQVKLRGLRIELGEVEAAISKVQGVKNVVTLIRTLQGREHLCAYFTADHSIDIPTMKAEISQTLTNYMVPTAYLQMEAFPLTPNGKIDVRHLPDAELASMGGDFEKAANNTEQFFADVFCQILGLDKVSVTDSFFELGGTSLVVTRVIIEAQKAGYKIAYADVFANPTPRQLSALVSDDAETFDPDADIKDFDYSQIDKLLEKNTLEEYLKHKNEVRHLGNVLLTGASGFLGIHIFNELIKNYPDSKIYCLLRGKHGISAEERFRQMLFYYFEDNLKELFGQRIFVKEGDVTNADDMMKFSGDHISTVINCAAIVKHFSKGTEIEDVNVGGVVNCVDFCLKNNARLIQVSTMSVGGASVNGYPDIKQLSEQMLFKGQIINNQYIHSKIMGERYLLDAVVNKGLDGKIMRVGTLSARNSDGEYQINFATNSFMGRLRVYQMLGVFPYDNFESKVEFSPIDEVAAAICLLAQTHQDFHVFHPFNNHFQMLGEVIREISAIGTEMRYVEMDEYKQVLTKAEEDEKKQKILSALLAYQKVNLKDKIVPLEKSNKFTTQVLLRMGFQWSATNSDYVDQFLHAINALNYFNI